MSQTVYKIASFVASHTCTVITLFSNAYNKLFHNRNLWRWLGAMRGAIMCALTFFASFLCQDKKEGIKKIVYVAKTRRFFFACTIFLISLSGFTQNATTYADTSKFKKRTSSSGNELQIENSTKTIKGFLFNYDTSGNTRFKIGIDTIYSSNDTLYWRFTNSSSLLYEVVGPDVCDVIIDAVDEISDLEAYDGTATTVVVNDSLRGGVFTYYASGLTTDDGVVFDATGKGSGYWKRLYTEQEGVNVRWWGAIGDSSTLNSGYIQSAINFAFLNDVGMAKMPSGDYAINTTIQMKRGVRLVGSWVANSVDNFVSEEPLEGGTNLYASGLTGDFIQFDFTQTNSECPWSAGIYNINIWGNSQTSGYGVHFIQPSSGNGPAENGKIFSAGAINNCNIFKCYDGGIYAEFRCDAIDIDRVNVSQTQSGHGITIASTDCHINFTYSWKNQGSGLYITGTTTRILNSDFWDNNYDSTVNNSGSGIIDEGQVNFYQKVQCDNNDLYGVRLLKGTTYPTLVGRQIVFEGCRFLSNGELTDSTYSDIKIDSVQNSSISARIINCEFDYAANETNKVLYAISLDTIPSVLEIVGCFFGTARSNSALLPVNDFVAMYADIVGSRSSNSQLNNSPVQLEDGETGLDVQRGFLFETNNTSTTVIGGISGGKIGQKITVMVNDDYTQFDFRNSPTLHGFGGQKYVANRYDIVTCVTADGTNFGCIVSPVDTGGYWQREANYLTTKGTLDTVDVNKLIVQNDIFSTKRVLMHDTTVTANYTATTNDYLIRVDATSGNITVTVPTPFFVTLEDIQYQSGFIIERIDSSANVVTIQRGSVFYTVNNGVSVPINSRATAFVFSGTSTNWDVTYTQFNTLSTDNTATLINKTIAAGSNTITGISATNMSYSAYSFIANSTNATAVPSDRTFKEFSEQTISTTITWSGTTAPSGSTNNTYRWTQIGKMVNLYINISYSVAGTANTQILIDLPSDLPAPEVPTGFSGANAKIVFGTGGITTATTANFSGATRSFLTRNSGDSGWQIGISNSSSANAQAAFATISYKIP